MILRAFFLLISIVCFAQQSAQLALQQGHSNMVSAMVTLRNDQYLASAGWDNVIKVWELRSGLLLQTLSAHSENINALTTNADGSLLISGSSDKTVRFWDTKTFKNILTTKTESGIDALTWSSDKRTLIVGGSNGIYWINPADGKIIRKSYFNANALAMHPTKNILYFAFYNYSVVDKNNVYALDLKTDSIVGKWFSTEKFPKVLSISPDGKKLIAGGKDVIHVVDTEDKSIQEFVYKGGILELKWISNTEIAITNYFGITIVDNTGKELQRVSTLFSKSACFDKSFKTVFIGGEDGSIQQRDLYSGATSRVFKGSSYYVQALHFGAQGKLTTVQNGEVNAWYLSALRKENLIPRKDFKHKSYVRMDYSTSNYCDRYKFSSDGAFLIAAESKVSLFDLNTRQRVISKLDSSKATGSPVAISKDGSLAGVSDYYGVKMIDLKKDSLFSIKTENSKSIHLGNTGKYFLSTTPDKSIAQFSAPLFISGKTFKSIQYDIGGYKYDLGGTGSLCPSRNDKNLVTFGEKLAIVFDLAQAKEIKKLEGHKGNVSSADYNKDNTIIATGDGEKEIKLWETTTYRNTFTLKGHSERITALSFSADKNLLASGSDDGIIKIWNPTTGKEIATMVCDEDENYVIVTPDNYYAVNKNGHKMLAFRVGTEVFPFEQFDLQYNRPDIVLSRLGFGSQELINSYKKAYDKRLKKLGYSHERFAKDFHLPQIEVTSKNLIPSRTDKNMVELELKAIDSKYKLDRLYVSVNDVPIHGSRGKTFVQNPAIPKADKETLQLSKGLNKIAITVMNEKGIHSLQEVIFVEYAPVEKTKPDLFIISIGTSKYKSEQYNLNYASKDASDLCELFATRKEDYERVVIEKIADENCTLENIKLLRDKLMNTRIDDEVILFIAGHGVLDQDLNYYLATHDMDFAMPSTRGLPYEKLEELLDGIPARKKLLLMDACHSGEVDKEEMQLQAVNVQKEDGDITFRNAGPGVRHIGLENSFEMMKQLFTDLRKGNGTTVISSAGGGEYAMEGAHWKNGVFTYSLVSGLRDKKADKNKDGKIMLSELQEYLQKTVSEMTNGKQKPTSRTENIGNDWQIW